MILITSAAYVNPELRNEFGLLPPTFLPVGNQRLFEHQVRILSEIFPKEKIYITLPSSYMVNEKDLNCLISLGVQIIRIDENVTLSTSIFLAIEQLDLDGSGLRILHGDTLLGSIPRTFDLIAVADTREDYYWEIEDINSTSELVWCGYFSFSDIGRLQQCFSEPMISFVQAIKMYSELKLLERVLVDSWSDFGHINTYFQSRTKITTERSFNSLCIKDGCVYKTSDHELKINAEAVWFKHLPPALKIYCPQLIDFGVNDLGKYFYALEYLAIPPLNEIYVHGSNPVFYWGKIFKLFMDFFKICQAGVTASERVEQIKLGRNHLIEEKTIFRVEEFFAQNQKFGWDTSLSIDGAPIGTLSEILNNCLHLSKDIPTIPGLLHGDFCLSNILFDSRADRIKVIDPRGLDGFGQESIVGDLSYDVAKLTHSIIGLYDHIIAGAYKLDVSFGLNTFNASLSIYIDQRIIEIQELFLRGNYLGVIRPVDVMPSVVLLFLSMLPLHADNQSRQLALLGNALRIYALYVKDRVK